MTGSLLTYLDVSIGFALIMLLACSIVTALSQWLLNLFNQRAVVLKQGLMRLMAQVDRGLEPHVDALVERVLLHPLVAGKDWMGKDRPGSVIQREELIRVLLDVATGQSIPGTRLGADTVSALRQAFGWKPTDGVTPQVRLDAIQERFMRLEVQSPATARHFLQAQAIVENVKGRFVFGLMSWFDETSDRMTQFFAQRARTVTIVLSVLVAVALPLDSIDLVRRLSQDSALRNRLVEAAQKIEQAQQQNGKPSACDRSQTENALKILEKLDIVPPGGGWAYLKKKEGGERLSALFGILLSICLMSFGAPFWYEALKNLLKLRPSLAQKESQERRERRETLGLRPAISPGMPRAESGEQGGTKPSDSPGTEV